MKNIITEEIIELNCQCTCKEDVISLLGEKIALDGRLFDKEEYIKNVFDREKNCSTFIGFDIATPHGKTDAVKEVSLAFAKLQNPIKWTDGEMVKIVFQIAVPESAPNTHLKILSSLARNLMHEEFRNKLCDIESKQECLELINNIL